jgi:hypothetical protein
MVQTGALMILTLKGIIEKERYNMVRATIASIALPLSILCLIFATWSTPMAAEKFEWLPSESADYNYPMQVVEGKFILQSNETVSIPAKRIVRNGWGQVGSVHLVGEDIKSLPEKLAISWFSFTEDKFYSGIFDLPKENIQQLFERGYLNPVDGSKTTYNTIIVGLAPEGEISLWLSGHVTTEVAAFTAKEADIEWSALLDNPNISRQDYISLILEEELSLKSVEYLKKRNIPHRPWQNPTEIRASGVPHGLWQMYRERFLWKLEITGNSQPLKMWVNSFNGEKTYTDFNHRKSSVEHLPVPQKIDISWASPSGKLYSAILSFEEDEIFKAFQKYKEYDPEHPAKLRITIGDLKPSVDVALRNDEYILYLKNCEIQVYRN